MDCQCPIWMYGRTADAIVPRQATKLTDLKEAEALRDSLVARDKDEKVHGPRLEECIQKFLATRQGMLWRENVWPPQALAGNVAALLQRAGGLLHA